MHHLAWCGVTIFSSVILSIILRVIVYRLAKSQHTQALYDELAGNFVAAVTVMELSVLSYVRHDALFYFSCVYGYVFLKVLYFSSLELYATPLSFVDLYYAKNRKHPFTFLECVLILVTQSVGTLVGIYYAKYVWIFEDAVHINAAEETCLSNLSEIHEWYECFGVEMFGTFLCAFVDFNMFDSLKPVTRPLMILIVILSFGHITGTWMNPMLATVFTFRCEGHSSDLLHVAIYWIAPLVGLLLAWEIQLFFKGLFTKKETSKKKKE